MPGPALFALLTACPPQSIDCLHRAGLPCTRPGYDVVSAVVDGELLILGGFVGMQVLATRRLDAYDATLDRWTARADLPVPVTHAPAVVVGREVWLIGGFVGDHPGAITSDVWCYDFDQNTWRPGPSLPQPFAAGGAARLGTRVHVFGGLQADRDTGSAAHFVYDVASPNLGWVPKADLPEPRNHLSGVAWQGFVWAIGGQQRHDTSPYDTDLVHVYVPQSDQWVNGPRLPFPRSHAEGATFADATGIVMVGGRTSALPLPALNDVATLELGANSWRNLPPIPRPLVGTAAAAIAGDLIVTAGSDSRPVEFVEVHRRARLTSTEPAFRTNCGGSAFVGAEDWCADLGADLGALLSVPATTDVLGTEDDALYRVQRHGGPAHAPNRLRYRLASPPGAVRVTLHFAELWSSLVGARVFDIVLQGQQVESGVDLFRDAGPLQAFSLQYDVSAPFELVDVELVGIVGAPILAALELHELPAPHLTRACVGQTGAAGAAIRLDLAGSTSISRNHARVAAQGGIGAGSLAALLRAQDRQVLVTPSGTLCIGPTLVRSGIAAASTGGFDFPLDLGLPGPNPPAYLAGAVWHFQCWYRDGVGFGFSDALTLAFTP